MKYRVKYESENEFTILTEDKGIAEVHDTGEELILTMYQDDIDVARDFNSIMEALTESKQYIATWTLGTDKKKIIDYALDWLVCPFAGEWEHDDKLFSNIFD